MKNKRAFVYVRVSTVRQAEEGHGLDAQLEKCRQHAERLGLPVTRVFRDEGISGRDGIDERPGLRELLTALREDPDAVVIVYSVSRLARRQSLLFELLDKYKLPVSSATEPFDVTTPIGKALVGMLGVFAELEADMTRERIRDGLAAARAKGVRLGAPSTAKKSPEVAAQIRALADEGLSCDAIARRLNTEGAATVKGGRWWPRTIRRVLAEPAQNLDAAAE